MPAYMCPNLCPVYMPFLFPPVPGSSPNFLEIQIDLRNHQIWYGNLERRQ